MQAVETEVKVRLDAPEQIENALPGLGFAKITPRTFERNILFDTSERQLRKSRQILRIREYGGKWIVTHKSVPPNEDPGSPHKKRIETETEVEDGVALAAIFESLGLRAVFTYEKWRTEWADRQGHLVLDETPLGVYAEIEGPDEWIDAVAHRLKIDVSRFIKLSYGRIFETWRDETQLKVENLTFAEIPAEYR